MLYDQGYYYGKMDSDGLKIHNSSCGKNNIFSNLSRRPREFDNSLVAEYTEYNSENRTFCYIGAIKIDQGIYDARYTTLHHIFVPQTPSDLRNPYSYIRYIYPYYYSSSKALNAPIYAEDIPGIELGYYDLLKYCGFDGEASRKRLAALLEIMYSIIFMDKTAAIVLPDSMFATDHIPETLSDTPTSCYQFSAALMLLLHLLVPDCFSTFNSVEELRIRLKHSIVKNVSYKNGFCFISRSDAAANMKCDIFDIRERFSDYPEDSFYYALAGRVQESQESMYEFLESMCREAGTDKFSCRQKNLRHLALRALLKTYKHYYLKRTIAGFDGLMSWNDYVSIISASEDDSSNNNYYYKEYLDNLVRFNGHGQIPDDNIVSGFRNILKKDDPNYTDATVFLLCEYKNENNFRVVLSEVINDKDIFSRLIKTENNRISAYLNKIPDKTEGIEALKKCTDILKIIKDTESEPYSCFRDNVLSDAKILFEQLDTANDDTTNDKRIWTDIISECTSFKNDDINQFIYDKIYVSDKPEQIKLDKENCRTDKTYDRIFLKKIYSQCVSLAEKYLEEDKNGQKADRRKDIKDLIDICETYENASDYNETFEKFEKCRNSAERYYKIYDIEHAQSFYELGECPENDEELQICYINRLIYLVKQDEKNIKFVFEWAKKNKNKFGSLDIYKNLEHEISLIMRALKAGLFQKLESNSQQDIYHDLCFIDSINNDNFTADVWNEIPVKMFSRINKSGYKVSANKARNIRIYLFDIFSKFLYNETSAIIEFNNIFSKEVDFEKNIKDLLNLDSIVSYCRQSGISMTNFFYLASLTDDKTLPESICIWFEKDVPETVIISDDGVNDLRKRTYSYQNFMHLQECIYNENGCDSIFYELEKRKDMFDDLVLIKENDKEDLRKILVKAIKETESKIFDEQYDINEWFINWKTTANIIGRYKAFAKLLTESSESLFDKIINTVSSGRADQKINNTYLNIAGKISVDEERKSKLRELIGKNHEQENITNRSDTYQKTVSIPKKENTDNSSIHTEQTGITNHYNEIRQDNFRFDRKKFKDILNICINEDIDAPKIISDILKFTSANNTANINILLFAVYVIIYTAFAKGKLCDSKEINEIYNRLSVCCNISDSRIRDNNISDTINMLCSVIEDYADKFVELPKYKKEIFMLFFNIAAKTEYDSEGQTFIHIKINKAFNRFIKNSDNKKTVSEFIKSKYKEFRSNCGKFTEIISNKGKSKNPYNDLCVWTDIIKYRIIKNYIIRSNKEPSVPSGSSSNVTSERYTFDLVKQEYKKYINAENKRLLDQTSYEELRDCFISQVEYFENQQKDNKFFQYYTYYMDTLKDLISMDKDEKKNIPSTINELIQFVDRRYSMREMILNE